MKLTSKKLKTLILEVLNEFQATGQQFDFDSLVNNPQAPEDELSTDVPPEGEEGVEKPSKEWKYVPNPQHAQEVLLQKMSEPMRK